ncbi:MAG: 30S ribosome-binding factor RbfA [Woeseiaceae bacterium]|nr:30S ribosome-binding factor RbfA [Woeseiaceae bacterium]NIP20911.1 30S ribosome-binding factor RbfA [Woeseiaceae bacterium]NIS89678.1 30S ribosome-binding factor RbfA [Woeseiaceae bacterium]
MPREFARHQRLGTQIMRILSELLRFETKDPRLQDVSLTGVDLSRDLSVAKIYFSLLKPEDSAEEALAGLEKAAGFLRGRLGNEIKVRHVPELRFIHDDSVEHGMKISELIDGALRDS